MKKKYISSVLALLFGFTLISPVMETEAAENETKIINAAEKETRAAWVSTVFNIDFPKTNNSESQKKEIISILDELKDVGINTVIFQVRPTADALYDSEINPWSKLLTGTQGKDPGYDPLEFIVEEAHKRGMELHSWLNPYRITMLTEKVNGKVVTKKADIINTLSENHPARLNPDMAIYYNQALYYNPESAEVKKHIADTVTEIVKNYDVDAIHFDDYFYPNHYPLPNGEGKNGAVANARRAHVNDMVRMASEAIEKTKPSVEFGISPIGIWKNNGSDSTGSATNGNESYYAVFGDTREWIANEWIDYVTPQIYWKIGHKLADYKTLVEWWSNEVKGTDVDLYIGHGIYEETVAKEIKDQLALNKKYPEVKGSMFFTTRDLKANNFNVTDSIREFYKTNSDDLSTNETVVKKGTVNVDVLNVRKGNDTSYSIVTKLKKGNSVTILESKGNWHKIKTSDNKTGWVSSEYIKVESTSTVKPVTPTKPNTDSSATTKTGTVINGNTLNVRKGNSTSYSVVTKIKKGAKVSILETKNGWHKVKTSNNKTGWVSGDYIKVTSTTVIKPVEPVTPTKPVEPTKPVTPSTDSSKNIKTGTVVNGDTLNVRKGNSTSYSVITKIKKGAKVSILETKNGWHKVKTSNNKTGWVSGQYIKVSSSSSTTEVKTNNNTTSTSKKGTVINASVLNVRKGNSTSYGIVTKIKKGAKVSILETKNGWHKIKTSNNKTGWVSGAYIK